MDLTFFKFPIVCKDGRTVDNYGGDDDKYHGKVNFLEGCNNHEAHNIKYYDNSCTLMHVLTRIIEDMFFFSSSLNILAVIKIRRSGSGPY